MDTAGPIFNLAAEPTAGPRSFPGTPSNGTTTRCLRGWRASGSRRFGRRSPPWSPIRPSWPTPQGAGSTCSPVAPRSSRTPWPRRSGRPPRRSRSRENTTGNSGLRLGQARKGFRTRRHRHLHGDCSHHRACSTPTTAWPRWSGAPLLSDRSHWRAAREWTMGCSKNSSAVSMVKPASSRDTTTKSPPQGVEGAGNEALAS